MKPHHFRIVQVVGSFARLILLCCFCCFLHYVLLCFLFSGSIFDFSTDFSPTISRHCGTALGPFGYHFVTNLGPFWDQSGTNQDGRGPRSPRAQAQAPGSMPPGMAMGRMEGTRPLRPHALLGGPEPWRRWIVARGRRALQVMAMAMAMVVPWEGVVV